MNDMSVVHKYLMDASHEKIEAMEDVLIDLPQTYIEVKNGNSGGMYTREILIPAGTLLTGRVHLFDYVDIMLSGDITVATEEGPKRYTGANVFHGKSGRKRAGYAHQDTRWITVHNWDSDNGDEYYNKMTCVDVGQYLAVSEDRKDYMKLIAGLGLTEHSVRREVEQTNDMRDLPVEFEDSVSVACSFIEGDGLIASKPYSAGDLICPALIDGMRTIAGRYSNHSLTPNAEMQLSETGFDLIAISDIPAGYEITTNYRNTLNVRGIKCPQ